MDSVSSLVESVCIDASFLRTLSRARLSWESSIRREKDRMDDGRRLKEEHYD